MAELKFTDEQLSGFRMLARYNSRFLFFSLIKTRSGYSGRYTRYYRVYRAINIDGQLEVENVTWHVAKITSSFMSKEGGLMLCSDGRDVVDMLNRRYAVFLDRSTSLPDAPKDFVYRES